jgi:hypothetical protein
VVAPLSVRIAPDDLSSLIRLQPAYQFQLYLLAFVFKLWLLLALMHLPDAGYLPLDRLSHGRRAATTKPVEAMVTCAAAVREVAKPGQERVDEASRPGGAYVRFAAIGTVLGLVAANRRHENVEQYDTEEHEYADCQQASSGYGDAKLHWISVARAAASIRETLIVEAARSGVTVRTSPQLTATRRGCATGVCPKRRYNEGSANHDCSAG